MRDTGRLMIPAGCAHQVANIRSCVKVRLYLKVPCSY